MSKLKPNKELEDLQNAAAALGKCGLTLKEAGTNLKTNLQYLKIYKFTQKNKKMLIKNYTKQFEL